MSSPREVISLLISCRSHVEQCVKDQGSSSSSSASNATPTELNQHFCKTQNIIESFINTSQRMIPSDTRTVKETAVTLFNSAKKLNSSHLQGIVKYVSGLSLIAISFTKAQCCSVFESAAKSFTTANDQARARQAYKQALAQLEGARDGPRKETLAVTCILGIANCLISTSSEEDLKAALEYIQSGTSLPSLEPEDSLRLQQFVLTTASKLSRSSGRRSDALVWLAHALRVHRQYVHTAAPQFQAQNNVTHENHIIIASNCLLLQLEIQIAQNDTVAAETTTHEHQELDRQHNMHRDEGNSVTTSSSSSSSSSSTLTSSLTLNMSIATRDRWNQAALNIAVQRKDLQGTKRCLRIAVQYATETSTAAATTATSSDTELTLTKIKTLAPLVGKRLRRLLDMTTAFAHLNGWSTDALMAFMQLAEAATIHLKVSKESHQDDRIYQQQEQQQEQQRQTVYLDVVRRVMSELVNQYRCQGMNVTTQLMQVYATIDGSSINGHGRKVLISILAEYGTLLYHAKRWADGQSIMTVLLATMNENSEHSIVNTSNTSNGDSLIDQTSIESVHHLLAEMLSFQEQHEQAMEEMKAAGDSFDAHNLRFRLLLRKLHSTVIDSSSSSSSSTATNENGNEQNEQKEQKEQKEQDASYKMLLLTAQKCMSSDDITDRGLLSIAYALQKYETVLPKLRHVLCDVLTRAVKLIATKAHILEKSIVRGQIFSNLMSLEAEMTENDDRLKHVAFTLQQLFISLKKYCNVQNDSAMVIDDEEEEGSGGGVGVGGNNGSNVLTDGNNMSTFIRKNDLRTCLRCALAVAHASYCNDFTLDEESGTDTANNARLALMETIYSHVHAIQQLTSYEELSACRIHLMSANLSLRRDVYNQDDIRRHLKCAKEALQASTSVNNSSNLSSTVTEKETNLLECMIASCEFALCARNTLPESETETISMLEKFSKKNALIAANGFFDRLADEAHNCTSSTRVPMRALSYELECRRRRRPSSSSVSSSASSAATNNNNSQRSLIQVAQCFRRLVDMCLDNNKKIKWLEDALQYVHNVQLPVNKNDRSSSSNSSSSSSSSSGNSTTSIVEYPADELRWLMATAWNSGLACMKVGDNRCGEKYLGVSIQFGQVTVTVVSGNGSGGGSSSKNKIADDGEIEDMIAYYADQNFSATSGLKLTTGTAGTSKRKR